MGWNSVDDPGIARCGDALARCPSWFSALGACPGSGHRGYPRAHDAGAEGRTGDRTTPAVRISSHGVSVDADDLRCARHSARDTRAAQHRVAMVRRGRRSAAIRHGFGM